MYVLARGIQEALKIKIAASQVKIPIFGDFSPMGHPKNEKNLKNRFFSIIFFWVVSVIVSLFI